MTKLDERTLEYLERVLALDPAEDVAEIGARTRDWRAGKRSAHDPPPRPGASLRQDEPMEELGGADRRQVAAALDTLRQEFWDLDAGTVTARLNDLDAADHPDLERAALRLRAANGLREDLDVLENDDSIRVETVLRMREMLLAPAKEGNAIRDELIRVLGRTNNQNERKALLRAVKRGTPGLERVERRWLERLKGAKRERQDSRAVASGLGAFFVGLVIFRVVRLLFRWLSES